MRDFAEQRALLLELRNEPGRDLRDDDPHSRGQHHGGQLGRENLTAADDERHDAEWDESERAPARASEADIGERDRDRPGKVPGSTRLNGSDQSGREERGHRPAGQQGAPLLPT